MSILQNSKSYIIEQKTEYFSYSIFFIIHFLFFSTLFLYFSEPSHKWGALSITFGVVMNQLALVKLVEGILFKNLSTKQLIGWSFIKMIFLVLTLIIGIHFMGKRVIISLIYFVISIFLIPLSYRKKIKKYS
jgi:hypothetical protein